MVQAEAVKRFNSILIKLGVKELYNLLESKKFPITFAVEVDSNFLYLPIKQIKELIDKDSIVAEILYHDINCTLLVRLKEGRLITSKDLNLTQAGYARIMAEYQIIASEINSRKKANLTEWELNIFFSKHKCSTDEAAYILCGIGSKPIVELDKFTRDKYILEFKELDNRVYTTIASGYYDEMDFLELMNATAALSKEFYTKLKLYELANFAELFKSWSINHPLYMANEFCKMRIINKNFLVHEKMIIKVLNDRKNVFPDVFDKEYPYLSKFLEENKGEHKATNNPVNEHLRKLGKQGGSTSKKAEELWWLAQHELDQGRGFTHFKRMLKKKHTNEMEAYEGIEGKCYAIYLEDKEMYYETDCKENQQSISIDSVKRYFTDVKNSLLDNRLLENTI